MADSDVEVLIVGAGPVGLTLAIALPGADPVPKPAGPAAIVVGPEGGLTAAERADLCDAGAEELHLGPYVLRIETAAEAAVAGLVLSLGS